MAKRRRSSRRRRRQKRSRLPAILFAALVATVTGYLLVRASDEGTSGNTPVIGADSTESVVPSDPDSSDGGGSTSDASDTSDSNEDDPSIDPSNLGNPVTVFSDTLGDLAIDQVIDDWTPVDRPNVPGATEPIEPSWVKNGRITVDLPDGYYWGIPVSTFDEDVRGINFDVRQVFWGDECFQKFGVGDDTCLNDYQVLDTSGPQLYPSYLEDLLFVSLAVYDMYASPNTENSNIAVVPATYWSLLAAGQPVSVTVPNGEPEPPDVALANSPFLLTIIDGVVIAAEGVWIP